MRRELREEKFWGKLRRDTSCWDWPGGTDKDGYGTINPKFVGEWRAHRIAWTLVNGPIPPGLLVLHRCDRPLCCNPTHLFLGSPADNMHDRHAKGRYATGDEHWSAKHPERFPRGEKHYSSKLTDAEVAAIRREYVDRYGMQTALAKKYKVSQSTIHLIVRNKQRTA